MNEFPSREEFLEQLNTKFRVFFDGENPTEVELIQVSELRRKPDYEAFSLDFLAPKTIQPQQMMYRVEHDALGTMDLFMAPIEENKRGYLFESLFNKMLNADGD